MAQVPPDKAGELFEKLLKVMGELRGPKGCPWDKKQTHQSLTGCLLEESYEVLAAIENEDPQHLKEELGDLLLQVVFHSQIAKEQDEFEIKEVLQTLMEKLIRRHPHVFGGEKVSHAEEAISRWEQIKSQEKGERASLLSGVPRELPALLRAYRMGAKAARVGFDWPDIEGVVKKVEEELSELHEEIKTDNPKGVEEEFGDLLFSLAQMARFLKVNPEDALRKSTLKFQRRFELMEDSLREQGKYFSDCTENELEDLWKESKSSTDSVKNL